MCVRMYSYVLLVVRIYSHSAKLLLVFYGPRKGDVRRDSKGYCRVVVGYRVMPGSDRG